jgi:hypothetical protein
MISRRTLKSALASHGVSYKRLSLLLDGLGEHVSDNAVAHRLSRGSFSFEFFLKVAKVVGIEQLDLTFLGRLTPPPNGARPRAAVALSPVSGLQSQLALEWSVVLPGARTDAEVREANPVGGQVGSSLSATS